MCVISNDSFLAVHTTFNFSTLIACSTKTLGSAPHLFLYLNSKSTDLKNWSIFEGINIFPLIGLALFEEWNSLMNKSISSSMTASNTLKLSTNTKISLQNCGFTTPRMLFAKFWKIYLSSLVSVRHYSWGTLSKH